MLTECDDLCTVIDWAKERGYPNIYLLGQSLGGVVSALAGANKQADITAMVLMYPALNFADMLPQMFPKKENIPEVTENFLGVPGLNLGRKFFLDAMDAPFTESIKSFAKPVLILHGTNDRLVPLAIGERVAAEYQNAKLIVVGGAEHGFNLSPDQAMDIKDFLES